MFWRRWEPDRERRRRSIEKWGARLLRRAPRATEIYSRLDLDPVREALERNAALMLAATGANGADDDA